MANLRVAVLESPNAVDLFDQRSEGEALVASCKLIGHQASLFLVKSHREFKEICRYLGAADGRHASRNAGGPLVLHISSHGNNDGIAFGPDFVGWADLVKDVEPILANADYRGSFALSLSSCGSGSHDLDEHLTNAAEQRSSLRLPYYIFSIRTETVNWDDALLGWLLLYHKLSAISIDARGEVQDALRDVRRGTGLKYFYHRWDENERRYRTHAARLEDRE